LFEAPPPRNEKEKDSFRLTVWVTKKGKKPKTNALGIKLHATNLKRS